MNENVPDCSCSWCLFRLVLVATFQNQGVDCLCKLWFHGVSPNSIANRQWWTRRMWMVGARQSSCPRIKFVQILCAKVALLEPLKFQRSILWNWGLCFLCSHFMLQTWMSFGAMFYRRKVFSILCVLVGLSSNFFKLRRVKLKTATFKKSEQRKHPSLTFDHFSSIV